MSKRRNENGQMRREEYEAADDGDSGGENGGSLDGGFQRAPEAAIARRKIVTARVSAKKPAASVAAPSSSAAPAAKPNAFAGFSDLVAPDPPAKANPFAGFSGLTAAAPAPAAPLSFGVAATPAPAVSTSSTSKSAKPTNYQEAIEVLNKEFLEFVNQQLKKNPSSDWSAATQDYLKHAQEIGDKFASTKPVAGSALASSMVAVRSVPVAAPLSVPSFNGVPKDGPSASFGAKKSESSASSSTTSFSFGSKTDASPIGASSSTAASFSFGTSPTTKPAASALTGGFSFGSAPTPAAPAATSATEKTLVKPSSSLFSFGAKPAEEKPIPAFSFGAPKTADTPEKPKQATGGFSFGAAPAAAPAGITGGFSFGAKPATSTAPAGSSGFSFSLSTTPAVSTGSSAPAPFAFGSAASTSALPAASSVAAAGAQEEEDEENIGHEEATVILKSDNADDDCVFETEKAKVLEFKKDEKRWADKGTHPLKVLVDKTTKNARILVRNEIGKIVLNAALYKGLAIKPHEAKGKKTGALLSLQVDSTLTQFILKVNGEKVDAFLAALESATPK